MGSEGNWLGEDARRIKGRRRGGGTLAGRNVGGWEDGMGKRRGWEEGGEEKLAGRGRG